MTEQETTFVEIDIKLFEELERCLTAQNEHAQKQPQNKQQKAYLEGIIASLEILTGYTYSFNKQTNKINKIAY
jgi:hypothetical protein